MARVAVAAVLAAIAAVAARPAFAEDETLQRIDAFGGLTIVDSHALPGQTQGTSAALGYGVEGGVHSVRGRNVFDGAFRIVEGLSFSPLTSSFFKSLDDVRLDTSYAFRLTNWLDFTVWGRASTLLFGSFVHVPQVVSFRVQRVDGLVERHDAPSLELTQPFLPLLAAETVGLGAHILDEPFLTIDARAGIGARQVLADDQLMLHDDAISQDVEVVELESHHALLPALELALAGELEDRLRYGLDASVRIPLAHTADALVGDRGPVELTIVQLRLALTIQILPWLTTDYELLVSRDPFFSDDVGLGNRLILAAHPFARVVKGAP